ncbi:MAG TPA: ROK family protein [Spirochaetota bacterium]|nr:ROK family protein [Spirochaetota bacterium]HPN82114.1 ROK family protein [Spirochaetota bacterium]
MEHLALGIDIGGSGIKAAIVNTSNAGLVSPRLRAATPEGARPADVARTLNTLVSSLDWHGPAGIAFPAVIQNGMVRTAANIDPAWIGEDVLRICSTESTCSFTAVLNDADAAGLALVRHVPEARSCPGTVLVLTVGTGLGTALFTGGRLVPNLELGHIELDGIEAEAWASDAARKKEDLSWEKWGKRLSSVLARLEALLWPDLIILGGGAAKKFDRFAAQLHTRALLIPSPLLNNAGIIGAAMAAIPPETAPGP